MAFQGSLEEASLPDVLQLLTLGQKSGRLALTEGGMRGEIYLDRGRVIYAFVASRRDRMGDMLVRKGRITRQQLDEAIARHKSGAKRVSAILLESGQVERTELEQFFEAQVAEAVYFMFTWRSGTFTFESRIRPPEVDFRASLDPEGLLLEGARRVDEWSVIARKIPSFDLVFRLDRARLDAAADKLTEEQRHLIPLVDGARDVSGIIELAGLAEFDVGKALYGLLTAGFAHLVERRSALRHLDYGEMLAYVVREGDFANPDRRRAAARHIADCKSCTARLKTIHVRRTGAVSTATLPALHEAAAPLAAPASSEAPERRVGDRRSGAERRMGDRRRAERRRLRTPAWERPGVDRRSGSDRRHTERRVSDRRLALSGPGLESGGGVALSAVPMGPAARRRTTGPRRVSPADPARGRAPSGPRTTGRRRAGRAGPASPPATAKEPPPAAPPEPRASAPVEPEAPKAAAQREGPKPAAKPTPAPAAARTPPKRSPAAAPDAEVPDFPATGRDEPTPDRTDRPVPATVRQHPRPKPAGRGPRTTDLSWLVTPDEADHLLRTSRHEEAPAPASDIPKEGPRTDPAASSDGAAVPAPVVPPTKPAPPKREPPAARDDLRPPARVDGAPHAPARPAAPAPAPASALAGPASAPARDTGPARWVMVAALIIAGVGLASVGVPRLWQAGGTTPLARGDSVVAVAAAPEPTQPQPVAAETPEPDPVRPAERPAARVEAEPVDDAGREAPVTAPPPAPVRANPAPRELSPARQESPAGAVSAPTPVEPAPAIGTIRGLVRDASSAAPLAGVAVTIPGTAFTVTTGADGTWELAGVPPGRVSLRASLPGRPALERTLDVTAGGVTEADLRLAGAPRAREADEELAEGSWSTTDLAAANAALGIPIAVIAGLPIETVAVPASDGRPRVRVAQLLPDGERIVLTQTRSGAPVPSSHPRVTALRVMPASPTYPLTTGTASFGNLLVTAKARMDADSLRALLTTLRVAGDRP